MYIHFDKDSVKQVTENYDKWWNGTLGRPLTAVVRYHAYEGKGSASVPPPSQATCHQLDIPPIELIKSWDSLKSDEKYEGDSFPFINFGFFGPGVLAAMCGGRLDNSSGAVWFYPGEKTELKDIRPHYDPENVWAKRIKDIYYAGLEYWKGAVVMGLPDLGGVMDVAASLRGTENLLTDLYDDPEEVLRLIADVETAWREAYADFTSVLAPQEAFTDWSGILSGKPGYIVQCDFCYMIGNPMFRRFVLPTLIRDSQTLANTIYHLDGAGELNHLDDILAVPGIKAVQWVPGASQPPAPAWVQVYEKIAAAGKHYWLCGSAEDYFDILGKVHGTPYFGCGVDADNDALVKKILEAR